MKKEEVTDPFNDSVVKAKVTIVEVMGSTNAHTLNDPRTLRVLKLLRERPEPGIEVGDFLEAEGGQIVCMENGIFVAFQAAKLHSEPDQTRRRISFISLHPHLNGVPGVVFLSPELRLRHRHCLSGLQTIFCELGFCGFMLVSLSLAYERDDESDRVENWGISVLRLSLTERHGER